MGFIDKWDSKNDKKKKKLNLNEFKLKTDKLFVANLKKSDFRSQKSPS